MDQEVGLRSKKLVALRPDQLLGFCHNNFFKLSLRMRADQEVGLVQKTAMSGNTWSKRRATQVMVTR